MPEARLVKAVNALHHNPDKRKYLSGYRNQGQWFSSRVEAEEELRQT